MSTIAERLARVEDDLAAACRAAGRQREEVELVAVSKVHPIECLLEAAAAGQCVFGENRVQEFAAKHAALGERGYQVERAGAGRAGDAALQQTLRVHLIGHLQSNKAARAVELFTSIDTVDSLRLAERLQESAARLDRRQPLLLEIKLSHEPSKEGLMPENAELEELLERLPDLDRLQPRGLMTVAPIDDDPEVARTCFRSLRGLRERLARRHPRLALETLSMGMSGDYAIAIEEGSTQVRLGTAIFGPRFKAR